MINKPLSEFNNIKNTYETKLKDCQFEDEVLNIKNERKNELKLFLYEANNVIKNIYSFSPSPYVQRSGYNALYQMGGEEITIKTRDEYYKDLDNLISNDIYYQLDEEKKALVNNAIEILKLYYEDSLK